MPENKLIVIKEWSGKYMINETYADIAKKLVSKYDSLRHVLIPRILFVDNIEGAGKSLDKVKHAQIGKIPEKYQDILYQVTGRRFEYLLEVFKRNTYDFSPAQLVMLIYHELMHIDLDGELRSHTIEEFADIAYNVGPDWSGKNLVIPNLLDDGVDFDYIRQTKLFDESEIGIRRVK